MIVDRPLAIGKRGAILMRLGGGATRVRRHAAGVMLFAVLGCVAVMATRVGAEPVACTRARQRLRVLDQQLRNLTGSAHHDPARPLRRREIDDDESSERRRSTDRDGVTADPGAVHAWHVAHDAEMQALLRQLQDPECQPPSCTSSPPLPHTGDDNDQDGLPDELEQQLLTRFRPYFRFSFDGGAEHYNPTDVGFYLSVSEVLESGAEDSHVILANGLLPEAGRILGLDYEDLGSSDITKSAKASRYHINPLESPPGGSGNPGRHGNEWSDVLARGNVGLYGHVVPVRLRTPESFSPDHVLSASDVGDLYIKIEYWQFFGYNNANQVNDIADHEGDWCSVQVLYSPERDRMGQDGGLCAIFHYAHGYEMRFDVSATQSRDALPDQHWVELRGSAYNSDANLRDGNILNNCVRLVQDPVTKEFCHPLVYVEYGGHEFWPTEDWTFIAVPNHNGSSFQYLSCSPPNLGEVEHPLHECDEGLVILRFNGLWGAFSRSLAGSVETEPPHGPPLHKQWTWPADSSIRWLLGNLSF